MEKLKAFFALEWNIQILVLSSVLASTGWLLWSPFIPLYLRALGGSVEQIGFVFSIRSATEAFMGVVSGVLADRIGRKKCIVTGLTLGATTYILCGLATDWSHLVIPLVLDSVGGSLIVSGMWAMIAESIPEKKRATAFATTQVFGAIAPLVGPAIGGYVGERHGYGILCIVGGVLTYIAAFMRWRYLKETLTPKTPISASAGLSLKGFRVFLTRFCAPYRGSRSLKAFVAINCLGPFAATIVSNYYVVFMKDVIGLRSSEIGYIFSLGSGASMVLAIPAGKLADRFGRRLCILFSYLASIPLSIVFLFSRDFGQAASIFAANIAVGALGGAAFSALLADITPDEQRATVIGTLSTLSAAFGSAGPTLGGYLWENYSPRTPFYINILLGLPQIILLALYVKPHVENKSNAEETKTETSEEM